MKALGAMVLQCYTWILHLFQQIFGGGVVAYIPDDIILNILSRLPAESIFQCREVCKRWLMLLSSYEFIEMQQRMATPEMIRYSPWYLPDFYIIDEKSEKKFRIRCREINKNVEFVTCCNGLMVFRTKSWGLKYFVLNPLLPARTTTIDVFWEWIFCGLFFHPLAEEYRMIFVGPNNKTSYYYHMYPFGSKEWRRTGCPSFTGRPYDHKVMPTIFNGALHWCGEMIKNSEVINGYWYGILIYNVVSEVFSTRPYPEYILKGRTTMIDLIVKQDRLYLCSRDPRDLVMEIWILEDYANWDWIKQYEVNLDWDVNEYPMEIANRAPSACEIKVLDMHNDELRLFWKQRGVFCCKLGSNIVNKINDHFYYTDSNFVSYIKSPVILPR